MINRFRVQNYKALRDVTLDLTPMHLLIGPNDSGKTSILEAIAALCRSCSHALPRAFTGSWSGRELVYEKSTEPIVSFEAQSTEKNSPLEYRLSCLFASGSRSVTISSESVLLEHSIISLPSRNHDATAVCTNANSGATFGDEEMRAIATVQRTLSGIQYYRWIPRLLSLPNSPDSKRRFRMEGSGFGLALCLEDILAYDRERFGKLEADFTEFFPQFRSIQLIQQPAFKSQPDDPEQIPTFQRSDGRGLYFKLIDGKTVSAAQISDGVLLVLAYLAILYSPERPRALLIEEPENGIHPSRLTGVLKILRQLVEGQSHTQVILTTHSPYVLDHFKPEEVTLCHKQDDGTVATRRLSESETVRRQIDVFTLGEIWTGEGDEALAKPIADLVGVAG